jgi:hypothetical protein
LSGIYSIDSAIVIDFTEKTFPENQTSLLPVADESSSFTDVSGTVIIASEACEFRNKTGIIGKTRSLAIGAAI